MDPRLLSTTTRLYLIPPFMKIKLDREMIASCREEDYMIENPRERIKTPIVPSEQRLLFKRKYWWLFNEKNKKFII